MDTRKFLCIAAAVAALVPAVSNAGSERTAMKACANAFAASVGSTAQPVPFKLVYRGGVGSTVTDYYATDFTFTLEAHDPKTGAPLARAVCSTNAHTMVTSLSSLPLATKVTTLADARR